MELRFGEVEIDRDSHEVRVGGRAHRPQPMAWAVLDYLVEHRARVVPKRELLDTLWEGSNVTESSLQRAVSLARAALGERGHEMLRTFPKQGYRFVCPPDASARSVESPRLRYAENGGVHLAYYTLGTTRPDGIDIIFVSGWVVCARSLLSHPQTRAQLDSLAKIGRVILFDKRGTGQSDRPKIMPDLQQRAEDLEVVLDALGTSRAVILGMSEGGALSVHFAASHPERTAGMVLGGAFARMSLAPGYAHGWSREQVERLRGYVRRDWGRGESVAAAFGDRSLTAFDREWVAQAEQQGASPGAALDLLEMNLAADVRSMLERVRVPVHVVHSQGDRVMSIESSRFLARAIPAARLEEVSGSEHAFMLAEPEFWSKRVRQVLALQR